MCGLVCIHSSLFHCLERVNLYFQLVEEVYSVYLQLKYYLIDRNINCFQMYYVFEYDLHYYIATVILVSLYPSHTMSKTGCRPLTTTKFLVVLGSLVTIADNSAMVLLTFRLVGE